MARKIPSTLIILGTWKTVMGQAYFKVSEYTTHSTLYLLIYLDKTGLKTSLQQMLLMGGKYKIANNF